MDEMINLITQNGIGIVCVAFMIYFISTTLKENNKILDEIQKTLVSIQTTLNLLMTRVDEIEEKTKQVERVKSNVK
jgi:uncharacterized protein YoxC